jgi:glycosyltransferase involved in cell wall biosynthesis
MTESTVGIRSDSARADAAAFTIIVPCYNERHAIRETIDSLREIIGNSMPYQLIIVDDGSTDGSGELLEEIAANDPGLVVLRHAKNRGYGGALKTGVRHASTEYIVITDADGTYPNERIPELVGLAIDGGLDMVVGARTAADAKYSKLRSIPKFFLRRYASWIAHTDIPDINSGLRVFRRDLANKYVPILPDGFSFTTTITLAMLTTYRSVLFIPIGYSPRIGKSKIRPIRDTLNFVVLIARTGMYFAPLRVILPVGLFIGLGFVASLIHDMTHWNLTQTTIMLLLFSLNAIMFALIADMIDKRSSM